MLGNPGVTIQQQLRSDGEIVVAEAARILPRLAILVAAVDGDVVEDTIVRWILPDRRLDPAMPNRVDRLIATGGGRG